MSAAWPKLSETGIGTNIGPLQAKYWNVVQVAPIGNPAVSSTASEETGVARDIFVTKLIANLASHCLKALEYCRYFGMDL